jgi:hypothetical protein
MQRHRTACLLLAVFLGLQILVGPGASVASADIRTLQDANYNNNGNQNSTSWVIWVLLGGGLIWLFSHHHAQPSPNPTTTSRPAESPSPSPSASGSPGHPGTVSRTTGNEATPQPSDVKQHDVNPPTIFGGEIKTCDVSADGWFEPTQGVWQDDPVFDDHKTKQLTRTDISRPIYDAELPMINYRDTVLFGVEHYRLRNNQLVDLKATVPDSRHIIRIAVTSDCSGPPEPVRMRFDLVQAKTPFGTHIFTSGDLARIRLTGGRLATSETVNVDLPAPEGIPPPPMQPFVMAGYPGYLIKDELITDKGKPTGLFVLVGGRLHTTSGLRIGYVPAYLTKADAGDADVMAERAGKLKEDVDKFLPDYFPMIPNDVQGRVLDAIDLSSTDVVEREVRRTLRLGGISAFEGSEAAGVLARGARADRFVAELDRRLGALARLEGYDRFVALLRNRDLWLLRDAGTVGFSPDLRRAGAALPSGKIVVVDRNEDYVTVAHEFAHTLPYLWSVHEMDAQCSAPGNYHNDNGKGDKHEAYGFRLHNGGQPVRIEETRKSPLMRSEDNPEKIWIAQCTYWNLANELRKRPDPTVILVRGAALQSGRLTAGILWPSYELDSDTSLPRPTHGPAWSITMRDAGGHVVATYPFQPQWHDENGRTHKIVPFGFQLPYSDRVRRLELRTPSGFKVVRQFGDRAPTVQIISQRGGETVKALGGKVHLVWRASGDPRTTFLSTVLYSNDGGRYYQDRMFEATAESLDLRVDPKVRNHKVRIVVTDGTRSAEAAVTFHTSNAP